MDETQIIEFRAATVREALNDIRSDLGPDAIILDQRVDGHVIVVRAAAEPVEQPQPVQSGHEPPGWT